MRTGFDDTSPLPRGAPRGSLSMGIRAAVLVLTTLAVALSCTDATTPSAPTMLNAHAALAVKTVLADLDLRVPDALEDATTRTRFADAIGKLNTNLAVGRLDAAERNAREAGYALSRAAELDSDGSGDADRSAIILALDVASQEITIARRGAAGGVK